ncbi:hypothetical protein LPUS_07602 [Lasallia pustulata]|uniref:Rhodopsin domain-containing protein n=1 Tax=Lasallia pustulata TaxID=136370 RepID=A0A1W5D448_9LECA|nr:hypothetical protein LPUS_07602 [Lasallia pustulata]
MPFLSSQDKANTGLITIILGWTFTALAALALALMAWAHRLRQTSLGADDSILVAAFIAAVILVLQITWAIVDEGLDRHISEVSRTQLALIARSLLANETLWGLVNTLVRVSALLFTKRIFGCKAWTRSAIWGLVIISVLYGVAIVLEIFLICRPLAATWDSDISGDCGDQSTSYVVLEIVGLFIDLAILILPLTALSKVQIPWRSKVRVGCVLSSGTVVMIITGLRIQALHITNSSDFTYSKGYIGLLSVLGGLLGVMTCCMPLRYEDSPLRSEDLPLRYEDLPLHSEDLPGSIVSVEGTHVPARSELKESISSNV